MEDKYIKQKEEEILNGQILGIVIFLISICFSLYVALEQKKFLEDENYPIDNELLESIVFYNRIVLTIAIFYFLYLSYETLQLARLTKSDTYIASLQVFASLLISFAGLISLYIILYNKQVNNDPNDGSDLEEIIDNLNFEV